MSAVARPALPATQGQVPRMVRRGLGYLWRRFRHPCQIQFVPKAPRRDEVRLVAQCRDQPGDLSAALADRAGTALGGANVRDRGQLTLQARDKARDKRSCFRIGKPGS